MRDLTSIEREQGCVRPIRRTYRHDFCMTKTTIGHTVAELFAHRPHEIINTYCISCRGHFPAEEFEWEDWDQVGA